MALKHKVLWIVDMNDADTETAFAKHALACNADIVCVRTSSTRLSQAIKRFKDIGLKVYAWRWPSAKRAKAMAEAQRVVNLIEQGLDGYMVDPESDNPGDDNDWNQSSLAGLAKDFCTTIRSSAGAGFVFGTTSGCAYPAPTGKPDIPFDAFFAASDVLLPQSYWRATLKRKTDINGGTPAKAVKRGLDAWKPRAGGKLIQPMAGEVDIVTPDEIAAYGVELGKLNLDTGHFYTDNAKIPVTVLAAIKQL